MKSEDFEGILDDNYETSREENSLNYIQYSSIISEEEFLFTRSRIATIRIHKEK